MLASYSFLLLCYIHSFGFKKIREVDESYASVPDRLVWGAIGTLMFLQLDTFYSTWTPRFRELHSRATVVQQNQKTVTIVDHDVDGSAK